ncbi:MAG: CAP domain-containing protein [Myxococcales bacterium]|nr:CAP domain-containing protein [Myxococcales bacterium]
MRGWGRAARACVAALVLSLAGCGDDDDGATGDSGESTGDSETEDDSSSGGGDDVPAIPFCAGVADWSSQAASLEQEVLALVNEARAAGYNCTGQSFSPTGPLTMSPALRCAARVHTQDMVDHNFFDHTNLMGEGPQERIDKTGYKWSRWGENIAGGNPTAEATVQQWLESSGHCANIMSPEFTEIGVGYVAGGLYGHTWTQVFGTPL